MEETITCKPAQVCKIFGIHKSTLLRWEREGKIPIPNREGRDRIYTRAQMEEIGTYVLRKEFRQSLENTETPNASEKRRDLVEKIARIKYLALKDIGGLYELAALDTVSNTTIQLLLEDASKIDFNSQAFRLIIKEIAFDNTESPDPYYNS